MTQEGLVIKKKVIKKLRYGDGNPAYKKEFCEMLIKHMEQGLSFECFCPIAGVSTKTLYTWAREKPEFKTAKDEGFKRSMQWHEKILSAKISGREMKGFDHRKSDTTALIFALKTRFKNYYGQDSLDIDDGNIQINVAFNGQKPIDED